ncbi:hypothetical protein AWENTII_001054 [Aspergillus wentii]
MFSWRTASTSAKRTTSNGDEKPSCGHWPLMTTRLTVKPKSQIPIGSAPTIIIENGWSRTLVNGSLTILITQRGKSFVLEPHPSLPLKVWRALARATWLLPLFEIFETVVALRVPVPGIYLDVIAKSFVWQFVQSDASYLKSVAGICDEAKDLDPHEIPSRLLFNNADLPHIDATFYIIVDGIRGTITEPMIKFLQQVSTPNRHVRVLLTGHPAVFEQLATIRGISYTKISINAKNRPDVELYTESRMNDVDALRDTERLGVPALRKKIRDSLCEKTTGDYFKINTILKHINTLDYVKDIDQVLEDAGKERSQQILGEIEKLNTIRSSKEIAEINEIIIWIIYGREWFTPPLMASVLYLKTGELSLLPLDTKLQTRYTLFEVDSDGDIDFRSLEMARIIPDRSRSMNDGFSPESAKRIQPTEVSMIRHFLTTVCPPEVYEKFDFESFFENKLSRKEGQICKDDKDNAEIKLAFACLRILTEERDSRRDLLHPYSVRYLLQHLSSVDLAFADREWKSAVGPRLLQLFTDEPSIDSLVWTDVPEKAPMFRWKTRSAWLDGEDAINEILRWFRDSAVISKITDQACRAWIANLVASPQPGEILLKPLARRMAVHWLREPSQLNLARNAFYFIYRFMNKMDHIKGIPNHTKRVCKKHHEHDHPTLETIHEIEACSEELLKIKTKDSLWEVQMAIILEGFTFAGDAENRCRHALRLNPSNWRASYYLARVIASNTEAIGILKAITERLQANKKWMQEPCNKKALAQMFFEMGQKYWAAQQFDLATQSHTKSLETNFTGYDRVLNIFDQYSGKDRWDDIVAMLEMIDKSPQADLFQMLVYLARKETIHDILLQTALETGRFDLLVRIYDGAIQYATETKAFVDLYYIRYHYANALYQRPDSEERAIDIWETALKEDLPRSYLDLEATLPGLIVKLAPVYLRKARAAGRDSEAANAYLGRILSILPSEVAENNMVFPAKLYLARYYHVQGDVLRAKQVARSVVKMALEILSDDDEENDYLAYWRLLLVFLPLGDEKNAFAAVAMAALANETPFDDNASEETEETEAEAEDEEPPLTKPKRILTPPKAILDGNYDGDESSTDSDSNSDTPEPESDYEDNRPRSSVFAICDGECGHCWNSASEMWWCKDCINITFDGACYQKLKHGWLPLNVCGKDHEFLHIPKWDEVNMSKIPKGYVPYGEKGISLEEWKREIRRDYVDFEG